MNDTYHQFDDAFNLTIYTESGDINNHYDQRTFPMVLLFFSPFNKNNSVVDNVFYFIR